MALRTHLALLFRTREPPRAWDGLFRNIQLYAGHPIVPWAPRTDPSILCSQESERHLPTGLVFHWVLPEPPRLQALLLYAHKGTGGHG